MAIPLPNPNVEIPDSEDTIFAAVRLDDRQMIQRRLREGVDINVKHTDGTCKITVDTMRKDMMLTAYSPIHIAILHSELETIKLLIDLGADKDGRDGLQRTPLILSASLGRDDVMAYLIEHEVDVNAQTVSQKSALMEAVFEGRLSVVKRLVDAGADMDLVDIKGSSALFLSMSSLRVNVAIMDYLIKGGCDLNKANTMGATSLMMAVTRNHKVATLALLQAGADVNQRDRKGYSPIHAALGNGQKCVVITFLIQHGADINQPDNKGLRPLDKAARIGLMRIITLLLKSDCERSLRILTEPGVEHICKHVSDFKILLQQELYEPRNLKRLCRGTLRRELGKNMTQISKLELPRILEDYMLIKRDL